MMKRQSLYLIILTLAAMLPMYVAAQSIHRFTEGLYLQVPYHYGREAVYTDEFLWHVYTGSINQPPREGQVLMEDETAGASAWTAIETDTSGFFRPQPTADDNLNSPNHPPGPGRIDRQSKNSNAPATRRTGSAYLYLTYRSPTAQEALLNVRGNGAVLVNGELHAGDPYRMGWMNIPIKLKKGLNEFFVRGMVIAAELAFPQKKVYMQYADATLPDIVLGKNQADLIAGLVVVNHTAEPLGNLTVSSTINNRTVERAVPTIPPHSTRKIAIPLDASEVKATGTVSTHIALKENDTAIDEGTITLRSVTPTTPYKVTFISAIDGSIQYYAVNPASTGEKPGDALFFSVHGAGVEAIGQARAYQSKDWGTLVAPTNRRPRGFNWEDWGRLDALEVLALAKETLNPDTQRIYLTGHSMGGHGTWFLGATYPDKWAAIAPCAAYPTLKGYGSADGLIPLQGRNALENLLLRSSNQSDVIAYASNYKPLGVYMLHGDADRVVSVKYARQMRGVLSEFHPDFSYYEYPGGSHWYSNESVDWKPLFDYFKWHKRKIDTAVNHISFQTANPAVSSSYYWAAIHQQQQPLVFSHIVLDRDVPAGTITGKTTNVQVLAFDLANFGSGQTVRIRLDSLNELTHRMSSADAHVYLRKKLDRWEIVSKPSPAEKGPHRNGGFKEAFNHRMVYVYGTHGTPEENRWAIEKAKYDAESWYYRGNGAFDMVADHAFNPADYADRNIILIGNAETNTAWDLLLADCPISVDRTGVHIGDEHHQGNDIGGYFTWKKPDSNTNTVGVITGTGIRGMQAAAANQYFAGASGFPDYLFFNVDMLKNGAEAVLNAGFYGNQWQILK